MASLKIAYFPSAHSTCYLSESLWCVTYIINHTYIEYKNASARRIGLEHFLVGVGAPRSLRIAFGARVVRVGSSCSLRIAFRGRIVALGRRSHSPRRLAALFSHCARRSNSPRRIVRVGSPRPSQQGNMCTQHVLLRARYMCTAACSRALSASRSEVV
jgi:hypothetical protein